MPYANETVEFFVANEAVQKEAGGDKKLVLKDVVLDRINVPTRNKTFYSWADMEPGLKKFTEMVERSQGYLYQDHPMPQADNVPLVPNAPNLISRAAIRVTGIRVMMPKNPQSDEIIVKADLNVLNTAVGKDVRACLEDGGSLGFSKRGVIEKWEEQTIGTERVRTPVNYRFSAYEVVIGQSVPGAEMEPGSYVYEQNQEVHNMDWTSIKTLADLKNSAPASLYEALVTEAVNEATKNTVSTDDLQKQVQEAVANAVKPLNDKISAQEAEIQKFKKGMETIVPALVDMGVVEQREESEVEKELRTQLEAVQNEKKTLEEKVTSLTFLIVPPSVLSE